MVPRVRLVNMVPRVILVLTDNRVILENKVCEVRKVSAV
jgi:hypothetical protein